MNKYYNFSASSPVIPKEVLSIIDKDIISYSKKNFSILELNYKAEEFCNLRENATLKIKKLLNISDEYEVFFINGGASMHFSMCPLNFTKKEDAITIINSDEWTNNALKEAVKYVNVSQININHKKPLPKITLDNVYKDSKYTLMASNNTTLGSRFSSENLPEIGDIPLIADMTSNLFSEVYDISKFSMIFASTSKNLGVCGMSLAIIKKDLLKSKKRENIPKVLSYEDYTNEKTAFTTPNVFNIYLVDLMCDWMIKNGGVYEMAKENFDKAKKLYDFIDESKLFTNNTFIEDRSITTPVFHIENKELSSKFLDSSKKAGFHNINGFNNNGFRLGLYNPVSYDDVNIFINFMNKFEKEEY